jgi:hypothetical protein
MGVVYLIRNLMLRDCHVSAAKNTSKSSYFQGAIQKHGADNFSIEAAQRARNQKQNRGEDGRFQCS